MFQDIAREEYQTCSRMNPEYYFAIKLPRATCL